MRSHMLLDLIRDTELYWWIWQDGFEQGFRQGFRQNFEQRFRANFEQNLRQTMPEQEAQERLSALLALAWEDEAPRCEALLAQELPISLAQARAEPETRRALERREDA